MPGRSRRTAVLGLFIALLVCSPATAQIPGPALFTFDSQTAGALIQNTYPGSGLTLSWAERFPECLEQARVSAFAAAKTPPHVIRVPCSPVLTAGFANPQAFVAMWVQSDQAGSPREIIVNGRDASGVVVATRQLPAVPGWQAVTLQSLSTPLAMRSVTVETFGTLLVDDIAVAQQAPQPDMRIESGPAAFTQATTAVFDLRGNWVGTRFQCSLDGASYTDCSPVDALTGRAIVTFDNLTERGHTLVARAVDWYGNIEPTAVRYDWTVDRTPPDTRIDSGPLARTTQRVVQIAFSSPQQADAASYRCRVDAAAFTPCVSPLMTGALEAGEHRIEIQAVDQAGNADATPAVRTWTVVADADGDGVEDLADNCAGVANADQADADGDGLGNACDIVLPRLEDRDFDTVADGIDNCPDRSNSEQADADRDGIGDVCDVPPERDSDADGVPDRTDNCLAVANPTQVDTDRDALGDACDLLPPGNVAPVAGVSASVQTVSGEVLVRVPGSAQSVSLKGIATVPVGSVVDTRNGRLALTSDTGRGRSQTRSAVAAAIFQIRQKRAAAIKRAVATELVVRTPPGQARACRPGVKRPLKGIVRTFNGTSSGLLTIKGAASVTTVKSGTWLVTDRCNGTLTEVGKGRASVRDRGRTINLAAGQSYLAKARLFAARQARDRG